MNWLKPQTNVKSGMRSISHSSRALLPNNGKVKMVVMDITEYEKQQETLALLKLLALGRKAFTEGKYSDAESFLDEMDDR
ncbi:hypothetical protein [Pectobacterium colocasium]|uniref:hypothetical protein n=1 Tax=Pectobacterium colocasium TaxID=2878098 RepID=UPI001CD6E1C6|nr:hypothetical protein [Pectobacterium colocasium]